MNVLITNKSLIATAVSATLLVGCGGDDDSSPAPSQVQTGQFIDAAVEGLNYKTATQEGVTNENGEFNYIPGEVVTFSMGEFELPAVDTTEVSSGVITPLNMGNDYSTEDQKAINIARILQSFDTNPNDEVITLGDAAVALQESSFDLSADEYALTTALTNASATQTVNQEDAKAHFEETLASDSIKDKVFQPSPIIGMWIANDTATSFIEDGKDQSLGDSLVSLTFQADGTYVFNQFMTGKAGENCSYIKTTDDYNFDFGCGAQQGEYSVEKDDDGTHYILTFTSTTEDANGTWGPEDGLKVKVEIDNEGGFKGTVLEAGDNDTLVETEEQLTFSPVKKTDDNPLAGRWKVKNSTTGSTEGIFYSFDFDNTTYWTFRQLGDAGSEYFAVDFGSACDSDSFPVQCDVTFSVLDDGNNQEGLFDINEELNNFDYLQIKQDGFSFVATEDNVTTEYNLVNYR